MSTDSAGAAIDDQFARTWGKRFVDAWNSHDPDQLIALAAPDVVWEDPFVHPDGVLHGTNELGRWLRSVWTAMPDLVFELRGEPLLSLGGDQLAQGWTGRGRMTGPLDPPGLAPTGTTAEWPGLDVHTFRDGVLTHVTSYFDTAALGRRIGFAPEPGSGAERAAVALQRVSARWMRSRAQ